MKEMPEESGFDYYKFQTFYWWVSGYYRGKLQTSVEAYGAIKGSKGHGTAYDPVKRRCCPVTFSRDWKAKQNPWVARGIYSSGSLGVEMSMVRDLAPCPGRAVLGRLCQPIIWKWWKEVTLAFSLFFPQDTLPLLPG